jgi:hypothetical protein
LGAHDLLRPIPKFCLRDLDSLLTVVSCWHLNTPDQSSTALGPVQLAAIDTVPVGIVAVQPMTVKREASADRWANYE